MENVKALDDFYAKFGKVDGVGEDQDARQGKQKKLLIKNEKINI